MLKFALIFLLILLSGVSLLIGPVNIGITDLFSMDETQRVVFFAARVPRLVTIIITGMTMSIAGLIMQCLSRNKFVSPSTAGTTDSARLGILVSMLFAGGAGIFTRTLFAFFFSLASTMIFMKILDKVKYKDAVFIPLVGIMYGNVIASITMFYAYRNNMVQNVSTWLLGDFSSILRGRYELIYITIPLLIIAYIFADKFIIAGMGDEFAKNLGLNHKAIVNIGLVIISVISSVVLLIVGTLPFLGLVVPNIVSILYGDNLKKTLPMVAIGGAVFLLICDIISRLILHPFEVPVNLTVGVIGGIAFLILLLRRQARG